MVIANQPSGGQVRELLPILAGVVGSVAAVMVTNWLAQSPALNVVGAVGGAAVGAGVQAFVTSNGPFVVTRIFIGVVCIAFAATYVAFAVGGAVTQSAGSIVPGPGATAEPTAAPPTTNHTTPTTPWTDTTPASSTPASSTPASSTPASTTPSSICEEQLCIQVASHLHCTELVCEPLTVTSTGQDPLRIDSAVVEGDDAALFGLGGGGCLGDPASSSGSHYLHQNESCAFTITFAGTEPGRVAHARLRINQNLLGPASFVDLEGVMSGTGGTDGSITSSDTDLSPVSSASPVASSPDLSSGAAGALRGEETVTSTTELTGTTELPPIG